MTHNNHFFKFTTFRYFTSFLWLFYLVSSANIYSQEKRNFLQHRFDEVTEIITKKTTKKSLKKLLQHFKRQGIYFRYKDIQRNNKNEITKIKITIKNNISSSFTSWSNNNKTIPSIKIGEINGIVIATSNYSILQPKNE